LRFGGVVGLLLVEDVDALEENNELRVVRVREEIDRHRFHWTERQTWGAVRRRSTQPTKEEDEKVLEEEEGTQKTPCRGDGP